MGLEISSNCSDRLQEDRRWEYWRKAEMEREIEERRKQEELERELEEMERKQRITQEFDYFFKKKNLCYTKKKSIFY